MREGGKKGKGRRGKGKRDEGCTINADALRRWSSGGGAVAAREAICLLARLFIVAACADRLKAGACFAGASSLRSRAALTRSARAAGEGSSSLGGRKENIMALQVVGVSLEMIAAVRPLVQRIRRHDRSLADQLVRAASSVALNAAGRSIRIRETSERGCLLRPGARTRRVRPSEWPLRGVISCLGKQKVRKSCCGAFLPCCGS